MFGHMVQTLGLQQSEANHHSAWWPFHPPPKTEYEILRDVCHDLMSFLWTINLSISSVNTVVAACLFSAIALYAIRARRKWPMASPSPDLSIGKSVCHKCGLCQGKKSKKTQSHWKLNELTNINEEGEEMENRAPLHKGQEGFYCTKKLLDATRTSHELIFEKAKDDLNENKEIDETSFEVSFVDYLGCYYSKTTVTPEKLSDKKPRSTSSQTSQDNTFESSWTLSIASEQSFSRQYSLSRYTSVGTNTSQQFSSEEIWETSSVSQIAPDEMCFVTNKSFVKNTNSSGRGSTWKSTRYSSHSSEKYSVPSSFFKTNETIQVSDSELAFSTELPPDNIYNLEEECAKVKNTKSCSDPFVQKCAFSTQENLKTVDLLQYRKTFQNVMPMAAKKFKIAPKDQGKTNKDRQKQYVFYQPTPRFPWLHESQVMTLELNAAKMSLESQWGWPFHDRKSLSIMMPPLSSLSKKNTEPTMKEIKPPFLPENEVYDLEFNLKPRNGMQQRKTMPLKEFYPIDLAQSTKRKPQVPTFTEKQPTCLKLSLGKNVTHKWNGSIQCSVESQKSSETPLKDGSFIITFKPEVENQLNMCITKQHLEIKLDCLPNGIMHMYELLYCPKPNKSLPKLIRIMKGHNKPRTLNIHFLENHAVDYLKFHLQQKLISNLWGSQNLLEKSFEMIIPQAPPVSPPIKARAAKIEPIGIGVDFIEEKARKHLESHITQTIPEFNWALPTKIQGCVVPPSPKLKHSKIKSQPCGRFDNKHKTSLEVILRKKIICLPDMGCEEGKLTAPQCEQAERILLVPICFKSELKDKFDMHLIKQCLDIKLNYLPSIVQELHKNIDFSGPKATSSKFLTSGEGLKKTRPGYIPFIESDPLNHLEMNLKTKCISQLWGLQSLHEVSMEIMIPKSPSVHPATGAERAQRETVAMETTFTFTDIRDDLEWHTTQMKHSWGSPFGYQNSMKTLIPAAPKLVPSKLRPQVTSCDLSLVNVEIYKKLEFNTKKEAINQRRGLPKVIQSSLKNNMAPAPYVNIGKISKAVRSKKLKTNEIEIRETDKNKISQKMFGQLKRKMFSSERYEEERNKSKLTNLDVKSIFTQKLDVCVIKWHLENQMNILPERVVKSDKIISFPVSKRTLPQLIVPRYEFKMRRASNIFFIEQNDVEHLDLNLKHKQINHLSGQLTLYIESFRMMIPSEPPVPPAIKASQAQIQPMGLDTPFIEVAGKNELDWHITQKTPENNWGLPLQICKSIDMLIPSAPKLAHCQLKHHSFCTVSLIPEKPFYISSEHRKRLELFMKKKIRNSKCGLPNHIQLSLKEQIAPSMSYQDRNLRSKIKEKIKTCSDSNVTFNFKIILQCRKGKLVPQAQKKISKTDNVRNKSAKLEQEYKSKLNISLLRQILNTKMHVLPDIVQDCYQKSSPAALKNTLSKPLFVREPLQKLKSECLPFVKQDVIHHLKLNQKHKLMVSLLGLATQYEKSMEMMIPKGPPVPPAIKASRKKIEPVHMELSWIEHDIRVRLDWHVTQTKLQQHYGRPPHIQILSELVIPPAPKQIPSQLNRKPIFGLMINTNDMLLQKHEHSKLLEVNIKKKKINQIWGLPTVIQSSWKNFWGVNGLRSNPFICSNVRKARNAGLSNIDKQSKFHISSQKTKKRTVPLQHKTTGKNTKPSKTKIPYNFTTTDQKSINKLDMDLRKMTLECKLHCFPEIIQPYYQNCLSTLEKQVDKIVAPGHGYKPTRSLHIAFIKQDAADGLELNQKHKLMVSLLGLATQYEKSMEMMIPKGPPVPPAIKASRKKIEPVHMELSWIEHDIRVRLDWHVTQTKLQQHYGRPPHIQILSELVIPPAPKQIPSQLNRKPIFGLMINTNDMLLQKHEHSKLLEVNIKKKKINQIWGLPTVIQSSWKNFWGVNGLRSNPFICSNVRKARNAGLSNIDKQSKFHISSQKTKKRTVPLQHKTTGKNTKPSKTKIPYNFTTTDQKSINKLDMDLRKMTLECKLHCFPEIIQPYYQNCLSTLEKQVDKIVAPGHGYKPTRSLHIAFIKQDAADGLELNQKHKLMVSLLGLATQYEKSMEMMIPKGPPVPPAIKASRKKIEPVHMELSWIEHDIRVRLDWHVTQTKLQQHYGRPPHIQILSELVIPPAPKQIPSQLNRKPIFGLMINTNDMLLQKHEHSKLLEVNIKKKKINQIWGLPTVIQSSWKNFWGVNGLRSNPFICSNVRKARNAGLSNIDKQSKFHISSQKTKKRTVPLQHKTTGKNTKPSKTKIPYNFTTTDQKSINKLDMDLRKMTLECKLHCFPEIIQPYYQNCLSTLEKQVDKIVAPGHGYKPTRSLHIAFIKQDAADGLELNQKHKLMVSLLGLATQYEKSMEMMIPKGPPVPPAIKASRKKIEPVHMELSWIEHDIRVRLDWHVTQTKLQQHYGRPPHIQILSELVIPPAPKQIPSQLNRKPIFGLMINTNDMLLQKHEHSKLLEVNIKKKKINQIWGLPTVIQSSWKNFWGVNGLRSNPFICSNVRKARNAGLSNIDKQSKFHISSQKTKKRTVPLQHKTTGKNTKPSKTKIPYNFTTTDQKSINKLDMDLRKMTLECKLHCFPEIIQPYYQNCLSTLEKQVDKIVAPGHGYKPTRSLHIAFIKQDAADGLELNQKHKLMVSLLGLATQYEKSMEMMIPKGPPVPPAIKASRKKIEPVHMELSWIEHDIRVRLDWHVTQTKLQQHYGRPPHIQILSELVIPPAPKQIPSQLNRKPIFGLMINTNDMLLQKHEHSKLLEVNIKKKKINQIWGLPTVIQSSWKNFWGVNGLRSNPFICSNVRKARNAGLSNIDKQSKFHISSQKTKKRTVPLQHKTTGKNTKPSKTKIPYNFTTTDQKSINKLDMDLRKMTLECKLHCFPEIIQPYYQNCLSTLEKQVDKIVAPGHGYKPTRSLHIAFIKQDAADGLELNQKHKLMVSLLGLATQYEKSMEMMIPKGPPVPPAIKASRKKIEPVHMELSWIEHDIRVRLDWHVTQTKLQQHCGRPPHIQILSELVIPPAPKQIPSQLNRKPIFGLMINTNDMLLQKHEHSKLLEVNIKKKKINQIWGLPTVIQSSWKNFWGVNGLRSNPFICSNVRKARNAGLSNIDKQSKFHISSQKTKKRTVPLQHKTTGKNTKPSKTKIPYNFTTTDQKSINKLDMDLRKMTLECKLHCFPEIIQPYYQNCLSTLEKQVDKIVAPGHGYKPKRSLHIAFIKQDAADGLELNQKHKLMVSLLGLATQYEKSMEMMIPKGPPVPPAIKASRKKIEPVHMELSWIEHDIRVRLDWHVTQTKLQQHCGRPPHIQILSELVIPPAPKQIPSQLNRKPIFGLMINTNDMLLQKHEHSKLLEVNIKKKKINQIWGLPTVIQSSWKNFWGVNGLRSNPFICSNVRKARNAGLSNIDKQSKFHISSQKTKKRTVPLQHKTTGKNTKPSKTKIPYNFTTTDQKSINKLDMDLRKMTLECKLHCFPEIIQPYYQNCLSTLEKQVDKIVAPGHGYKPTRSLHIAFIKQDAADGLELNQKHKLMVSLLGLATQYEKSMEMMIPKGPPVPPAIKASRKKIEPVHMELSWIEHDIRVRLDWHVTQTKLQQHCGRPPHIQILSELVIPPAPKQIPSQLNCKPTFGRMINTNDTLLLKNEHRKLLEVNIKKKKINQIWGLPSVIESSWKNFWGFNGLRNNQFIFSEVMRKPNFGLMITTNRMLLLKNDPRKLLEVNIKTNASWRDFGESSNVNSMKQPFACPKEGAKGKKDLNEAKHGHAAGTHHVSQHPRQECAGSPSR
ncbi:uncharacterized protein [Narcine bancroftii]|uniref:uncharacterized protein isoform X2 n=1 Tax=Narcine bancroftii TaxID=1343680 RepID=UPI003831795A